MKSILLSIGLIALFDIMTFLLTFLFYLLLLFRGFSGRLADQEAGKKYSKELARREELHLSHKLHIKYFAYDFCNMAYHFAFLIYSFDPDSFPLSGIVVFTGHQGSGKTLSLTEYALRIIDKYPKVNVYSNYHLNNVHYSTLTSFDALLSDTSGKFGVLALTDELQNLYNNKTSKEADYGLMECICQNRKSHRLILTTTQQFYFLDKAIRSQVVEVRRCISFKILNVVIRSTPVLDKDMNIDKVKFKGLYFYVPSRCLYESYDTYQLIHAKRKQKK